MKKLVLCFLLLAGVGAQAQIIAQFGKPFEGNKDWYVLDHNKALTTQYIQDNFNKFYSLEHNNDLVLFTSSKDALGYNHVRFQQTYKDIVVDAAELLIHEHNGKATLSYSTLVQGINCDVQPRLSAQQAIETALSTVKANVYAWQDVTMEATIKNFDKNVHASYYPKAELVISEQNLNRVGANYKTYYKFEIYALEPLSKQEFYVDAVTGKIAFVFDMLHTTNNVGTANTAYSGVQNIITDSVNQFHYELKESKRNGFQDIEVLNSLTGTSYAASVAFIDSDNYWNNFNPAQDQAATDAHWGTEMTSDFFWNYFQRKGLKDDTTAMLCYVHYDNNYVNAFWNGRFTTYGDGNGTTYKALTAIDIVAHEWTHGFTQFSSGLVYRNESGALNESFSDIFGKAVEYKAKPNDFDWLIGGDFSIAGSHFRSMSNPNNKANPDTYKGSFWYSGPNDNGGVHTNSGVQNYWYYLLVTGGSGVNDKGNAFAVDTLGFDTANAIAYRNNTYYLTRNSNYADARIGSLLAASDLYGKCSDTYKTTANAWYAVGVGASLDNVEAEMVTNKLNSLECGLSKTQSIIVTIANRSCDYAINVGDTLRLSYKLNSANWITETFILPVTLTTDDSIVYTFAQKVNMEAVGKYTLRTAVNVKNDVYPQNDTLTLNILNRSDKDVEAKSIESPQPNCNLTSTEQVVIHWQHLGCRDLPAGTVVRFGYQLDNKPAITQSFTLSQALTTDTVFTTSFNPTIDLSALGVYTLKAWVNVGADTLNLNDTVYSLITNAPIYSGKIIGFENQTVVDSFSMIAGRYGKVLLSQDARNTGNYGFEMTGTNPLGYGFELPDTSNLWKINEDYTTKVCFCVDATQWSSAFAQFDQKALYSRYFLRNTASAGKETSAMRLTVNGRQEAQYFPKHNYIDPYNTRVVNLSQYAGTQFMACFEGRPLFNRAFDSDSLGNRIFIDNVLFSEVVGINEVQPSSQLEVSLYPNPTNDFTELAIFNADSRNISVTMYDILGNKVSEKQLQSSDRTFKTTISTIGLAKGVYSIKIKGEKQLASKVLIIN